MLAMEVNENASCQAERSTRSSLLLHIDPHSRLLTLSAQPIDQPLQLTASRLSQGEHWQAWVAHFQAGHAQTGLDGRRQSALEDEVQ